MASCIVTDPVAKALWFIESHLSEEVDLEAISATAGVSRFHLARAFGAATGYSVMRYVRARRMTEAARALHADPAAGILEVALAAGYGSHEAFTRAFRDQFAVAPQNARRPAAFASLALVEPLRRDRDMSVHLEEPRVEKGRAFLVAGLCERFTFESAGGIPYLWQRFAPHIGNVPGQVDFVTYGVMFDGDGGSFEYVAGVEAASLDDLPSDLRGVRIAEQTYAVFSHPGHISSLRATMNAIWNDRLPSSRLRPVEAPHFERYPTTFDPRTGNGGLEIWIPIETT